MINVNYPFLSSPFVLSPEKINVLSVESPTEFYNLINRFYYLKNIAIYNDDKVLSLDDHCEVLLSPFLIDYGNKKIQNLLVKNIESSFINGEYNVEFNQINTLLQKFVLNITQNINLPIVFDEAAMLSDIIKILSVKIKPNVDDNILSQLIDYINVILQLKSPYLFVFINLRHYLSVKQSEELLQHCIYNHVLILLLESKLSYKIEKFENVLIIDNDLCDFIAK